MKAKRILSTFVAGAIVATMTAVTAFAADMPSTQMIYEDAEHATQLYVRVDTDYSEDPMAGGYVQIVDWSEGNQFERDGGYRKFQAIANDGYYFDHWETQIFHDAIEGDDIEIPLSDNYLDENELHSFPLWAFTDFYANEPYDATIDSICVNRICAGSTESKVVYDLVAVFSPIYYPAGDASTTVNYVYDGVYGDDVIYSEEVKLERTGLNHVLPNEQALTEAGFVLRDDQEIQYVNVEINDDGTDSVDRESVTYYVVPTVDPTSVGFTVNFVNLDGSLVQSSQQFFEDIGVFSSEQLILPEGYKLAVPAHPGEDYLYPTSLNFVDGEWQAVPSTIEMLVEPVDSSDTSVSDTSESTSQKDSPKTGDAANMAALGVMAVLAAGTVIFARKKLNNSK